ncbi:MAG: lysine--tRNA ligase [Deltaproteobacteria bacterium]|nr:lysine--tRNA ligase [Deltaproteobacteria bacterium]MBW2305878.1 lysine--tRNA ligase [Deltaproteobacteria bacterium]
MEEKTFLMEQRIAKYRELVNNGINPYPNDFRVRQRVHDVIQRFESKSPEELEHINDELAVAGRMMQFRHFGKATFIHVQDGTGRIQAYVRRDQIGEKAYQQFQRLDVGDFVGIRGKIFRTRTEELTVLAREVRLLAKSLRPLPEKWHGLKDIETRYRQRYLDLIVNPRTREIFQLRSRVVRLIRQFLDARGFLEVETPMMQLIPGGAVARPFKTYHNALDQPMYLRIAPELYLKRLLVGGLDRVYELNRTFRNEGISTEHNPEFTMLEFYQAYATYDDLMDLTEEMLTHVIQEVIGTLTTSHQGHRIDWSRPWRRMSLHQALIEYDSIPPEKIRDPDHLKKRAEELGIETRPEWTSGKLMTELFDTVVEPKLLQPTFIVDYPVDVSPLSRKKDTDPGLVDRFELFVGGREIANAFSELNDPLDQRDRFEWQARQKTEMEEAGQIIDEDYLRALEYGMPPSAGEGIGIDRLLMLLVDVSSIREVILFPQLRSEK